MPAPPNPANYPDESALNRQIMQEDLDNYQDRFREGPLAQDDFAFRCPPVRMAEIKTHLDGPTTHTTYNFLLEACKWLVDEVERLNG